MEFFSIEFESVITGYERDVQLREEFYAKANPTFTAENLISTLGKELFFQLRGNGLCQLI